MNTEPSSVLIVDDEPDNFDVIEALLFKDGYDLKFATSGTEAIERLPLYQPDVILLDVMMPELNGIQVCRQIKANFTWQHIPIIMVTALHSPEDLALCMEAGADDFISKPVGGIELRSRVRSMLRIKKQYDSLANVLRLREDLAHAIVHDLRNPITNILLSGFILQQTSLQPKQEEKVTQIMTAGQRLRMLTDDLLTIAKVESGKFTLNRVEVNCRELIQETLADFSDISQQKQIKLVFNPPSVEKTLLLDTNLMRRVLDNLLSNAIKFSPENSEVKIALDYPQNEETQVKIQVFDHGMGIKPEVQQRIFDKYEIGNVVEGVPQIGLGLAFCKMVIEAHSGHISVQDNSPQGSVFIVEL